MQCLLLLGLPMLLLLVLLQPAHLVLQLLLLLLLQWRHARFSPVPHAARG